MSFTPYLTQHASPTGPGDARPTALQIISDQNLTDALSDKVMIVTGCTSGIGVETARALHTTGATVYITARTADRGEPVRKDILSDGGPGRVEVLEMDLSSFESVRAAVADFKKREKQLNVLVNNAGIMACPESETADGHEMQFGTNHLGHFLFFQLLKPLLLSSSTPGFNSRVVSVSSTGHRGGKIHFGDLKLKDPEISGGYSPWKAYGQSKLANILFANELERRYGSQGLHANSLMPGGIATPLQKHLPKEMMEQAAKDEVTGKLIKSTEQGAATSVWVAVGREFEGVGGKYFEDCRESYPDTGEGGALRIGYSKEAFDEVTEGRLWRESCMIVGVEE